MKIILLLLLVMAGCTKTLISEDLTVELEIDDFIYKNLTVENNGTVIFIDGLKRSEGNISLEEVESLKQYISDNKFFSLREEYVCPECTDVVGYTITVVLGNRKHSVYCGTSRCPKTFWKILDRIEKYSPQAIDIVGFA